MAKFKDYLPNKGQRLDKPLECLQKRLSELPAYWESGDFENEIRQFLPRKNTRNL